MPVAPPTRSILVIRLKKYLERSERRKRPQYVLAGSLLPWLSAFVVVAALGLGLAFWFLAGNEPPNQAGKDGEKPSQQNHAVFDFRKGIDKLPPCTLIGVDANTERPIDPKGLRLKPPEGVEVPIWLRGDFDIAVGYELLEIGKPVPTYGAGVAMRVMLGEPTSLTALISRSRKPAGDVFGTFKLVKDAEGKEQYKDGFEPKATKPNGRMRLVRTGSQLNFFAAEGDSSDYKDLRLPMKPMEIGTEDVRLVRVYSTSTNQPNFLLDVRLTDLDIRADQILTRLGDPEPSVAPSDTPPEKSESKSGLIVALIIGGLLLFALVSALGVWLSWRRTRSLKPLTAQNPLPDQQATSGAMAPISFSCRACGKTLKATAELAGKKVKCSACGKAVLVP